MLAGYLPLSGQAILAGARYRYYPLEGRLMLARDQMARISVFPCHQPGQPAGEIARPDRHHDGPRPAGLRVASGHLTATGRR
ncbi:MAG: hypothetical protein EBR12_09035, partial [Proteobacteria bacterium]|nr:hypothetical protein [Pseudomonadota bacterium]